MKKALLSAAALVAVLALPGSPALAQTNEITIGISISTTGPADMMTPSADAPAMRMKSMLAAPWV